MNKALLKTRRSENDIRQSYFKHATHAQLYRWYQYIENASVDIHNQLDLLTDDVVIKSPTGRIVGKDQYQLSMSHQATSMRHAHQVNNTSIKVVENNALSLYANVTHTTAETASSTELQTQHFKNKSILVYNNTILPLFKKITVSEASTAMVKSKEFRDTYPSNRLKSLVHYLMAIVEHPSHNPEGLRDILAPTFDIRLSETRESFTTFDQLADWIAGPVSGMSATRHIAHTMTFKQIGANEYEMQVFFDWDCIRQDGAILTAKTRHTWIVADNPSERFARIKKIRIVYLEPYKLVT